MKLLKYQDFVENLLNEANVWRNQDALYVIHPNVSTKVPDELLEYSYVWTGQTVDQLVNPRFFMVPKYGKIEPISAESAKTVLKGPKTSIMKTEEDSNIYLVVLPDTKFLIQTKKSGETTTNVKEGMVVLFYQSSINSIPSLGNERGIINLLLKELDSVSTQSIDKKTIGEIREYLTKLAPDRKTLENLIDFWSCADILKNRLGGNSYIVSRSGIFNEIRELGSRITGFQADKWCPGDIYLVNPKTINLIPGYLKEIKSNIQPDSIEKLNQLFAHELNSDLREGNSPEGSIIAISLKKEKAQAGKAKQFLKSLTKDEREYNITKEDLSMSQEDMISAIEKYRDQIHKSCKQSITTVNLIQDRGFTGGGNPDKIQQKLASIKLAAKLLEDPQMIDDNVIKSVAFGMSLTGVNPTFFKIIGSGKGVAKYDKYPAGEMIYLMDGGMGNPESVIDIKDLNTNSSIIFNLRIRKGEEEPKDIQFTCKPNGNTQSTLEIEKIK